MVASPVRIAVVGAGARSRVYSSYVRKHPELATIVAVADPNVARREAFAEDFGVPPANRFASHADIVARRDLADAVINGTSDRAHFPTGLPLIQAGFNMLLEKPIAPTESEVRQLIAAAQTGHRLVMIGHVLRYAPFYVKIHALLQEGKIGQIVALRTLEAVSYRHMAAAFVTGPYNREETSNPMLMAKCCHDLDLIAWMLSGVPVRRVSSFGSLMQYKPENAPPGAGTRCLVDCKIEATCSYSARRLYLENDFGWGLPWKAFPRHDQVGKEEKREYLRTTAPAGRCVWHSDNDVVDHQSVLIEFANGVTATHDMWGGTSRPTRKMHIYGSKGEIEGDLHDGLITLRHHDPETPGGFGRQTYDLSKDDSDAAGGHGGGDLRLAADFVSLLRGGSHSAGYTRIEDSLTGHLIGFAADRAMRGHCVVEID